MVMGGDVSHPPPGSRGHPSISAVVGSMDINSCQYAADSNVQASREERITGLKRTTISLVKAFAAANRNTPPQHILFFRDGLSEGQFGTFGREEIKEMKDAFEELRIQPKLTFVCVGKGHHVRLFGDQQNVDRSGNCQPASSPSHYTVLLDEMGYSSDKLQSVAHALCHIYARSTRSVSIPAPVYYADIISARGNFHFTPDVHLSDDGDVDYTEQHYQQAWRPLHANQRQRMYYIKLNSRPALFMALFYVPLRSGMQLQSASLGRHRIYGIKYLKQRDKPRSLRPNRRFLMPPPLLLPTTKLLHKT
ncbi:Piwi domain-containing protein [Rhizoctonia solani AG-1 IA]|uniref:Piwi domain-containing protein n=1 Tax=Thanatephorus cucumeris (strain AG1-IA) TaxID=983506 RepID=L8XAX8_THACA|nr:Piwi domain-containing protein [Rhizoctonia solani AG-1 IA]